MSRLQIFRRILVGLSLVLLVYAIKNYLAFLLTGTAWCRYLCPSVFEWLAVDEAPPVFREIFIAQQWVQSSLQSLADRWIADPWELVSGLLLAPVVEECIYRGPLYLARKHSGRVAWWLIGILWTCVFALSHGRSGIALLPLVALGVYNLWLVAVTRRLWPAILLHGLNNFFFISVLLYHSFWTGD
jgi:membrane protease YdiL (CAAX protease family)